MHLPLLLPLMLPASSSPNFLSPVCFALLRALSPW